MTVRSIKVWNASASAWEGVGVEFPDPDQYVQNSLIDAAGDLLVGSADNTVGRLALGNNGEVLTVDTAGSGVAKVKWAAPSGGGGFDPFLLMGA